MNASETLEIIKMLHAVGASHFKSHDFEIKLGAQSSGPLPGAKEEDQVKSSPIPEAINEDATQKAKDLIAMLKMDDGELLDKIFPAGAGG